jgi:transposase
MAKAKRARYTLEFKIEAVRLVRAGQSVAAVPQVLGVASQTLHNWVQADEGGRLKGTAAKPVSPEQMESAVYGRSWRARRWSLALERFTIRAQRVKGGVSNSASRRVRIGERSFPRMRQCQ